MKIISAFKILTGVTLLVAASATLAKDGQSAAAIKDVRAASSPVQVDPKLLTGSSASEKSQGLPNANGEKPGNGNGYGHIKGVGRGHDLGLGHGHDSDPEIP